MQNHFHKMLFTLALLALCAAGASRFATKPVAGQTPTLQGAAALQQLKSDGGHASLAAALAAARGPLTPDSLTIDSLIVQQRKLTAADGEAGDSFGKAVALSGDTVVVGAESDRIGANTGQGSAYVFTRSFTASGAVWTLQQQLTASDGSDGDFFGGAVALSGDTLVVGASYDTIGANVNQGSAYVFTRSFTSSGALWTQQQKLTAGDGAAGDSFGLAVALSGDTVVAGAPSDTIGANMNQGSAYVFTRSGTVWTQQQKLTASDGMPNDYFGNTVAVSGDTVVVGAYADTVGANVQQGSAYVFSRSGTLWTQQQKLSASDGAARDFFGKAVALSGDTVVVGASNDTVLANAGQGSAYVFTRSFTASGALWAQQQRLTASDGAAGDAFGYALALSGDTVVAGAFGDDIGTFANQGAAYVFVRSADNLAWRQQQKLTAADGAALARFGLAVALSGDTVVAGAEGASIGANARQGAAYLFVIRANSLAQQQALSASDGAAGDAFGYALALSGDTVVVGAPLDAIGARAAQGSAYVFTRNGTVWTLQQKLTASDGAAEDRFGRAVALSGETLVVGAYFDDGGANTDQGSAYVFMRNGTVWTQQQRLTANDGAPVDQFGVAVALSGDTVVVGANRDIILSPNNQGSAYVFTRSGTVWTQQQRLSANDGADEDNFGVSVALSGDTVVVGAPNDDIGTSTDQGSAYVFTRNGAAWTQQQKLTAGTAGDFFGFSVALSNDTVVVGAYLDWIGAQAAQGSAYVFTRVGTLWLQQQQLTAADGAAGDYFGFAVALSGDTVVVGAQGDTIGANVNQGSAYVFSRSANNWTQQQHINEGALGSAFGNAVALSGDTMVVGAFSHTLGANEDQGAAYVFVFPACPAISLNPATLPNGVINTAYSQTVTVSGGVGPYQYSLSDGALPPGLRLAFNGVLSGTFTAAGTYRFTITATTLSSLCPGSRAYTVVVTPPCSGLGVFPERLPNGTAGVAYNQGFSAAGSTAPYSFTVAAGALPAGLTLSNAGTLSGTPTVSGAFNFTLRVTAANGCAEIRPYTLTIAAACPTITLNPATLPAGVAGQSYNQTLTATGGIAPFNFTISAGALPNGMSLSAAGLLSGAPTAFGAFNFTVRATDANGCSGTRAYSLTITPPCPTITVNPNTLPGGAVGAAYSQTITATGGASPYAFTVSAGNLPTGLSLSPSGALSGETTTSGAFNFTIRATDANGCQGARAYTLTIGSSACNFPVAPANHAFSFEGGNGVVNVNAADGCAWTAASNDPMIAITSGANGSGAGTVRFAVSKNPNAGSRRGTLSIAGRRVTVVQAAPVACVSAASFAQGALATESIVAAFGSGLAKSTEAATTQPLPATLAGTRVSVLDSLGAERFAPLFFVSPTQINFQVPPGTAAGKALVTILRDDETVAAESPQIEMVAPGLFSANASGQGLMIGVALRVKADGSQSFEPVARFDEEQKRFVAAPVDLGAATDRVFLVLFATGVRHRGSLGAVNVKIGGVNADALYAGPQGAFTGLDQLNVALPRSLAGRGEVEMSVTVNGAAANPLKVAIR